MANLTWQERKEAINALLSPDVDGTPIFSADHRDETNMGDNFMMSFIPIEAYTDANGKVVDARLINRSVGIAVAFNSPIQSDSISKPFASDTLEFTNGFSVPPGTLVTIIFKQQLA